MPDLTPPPAGTIALDTPCPVTGCTATIHGTVRLAFEVVDNGPSAVTLAVLPTFPVEWSDDTQTHIAGHMPHLTQVVPQTRSDERMHFLDATCWCNPTIDGDRLVHA